MVRKLVKKGGIFSAIDLNEYGLQNVPAERREDVKKQVGDYVLSQIKRSARNAKSPVAGEGWKASLSKEYAKDKRKAGAGSVANLRLTGSLMNSLTYKIGKDGELLVGNEKTVDRDGRSNDRKSIGHNHFEGGSTAPRRRFLPAQGQSFDRDIEKGIKNIVQSNQATDLKELGAAALGTSGSALDEALLALVAGSSVDDLI